MESKKIYFDRIRKHFRFNCFCGKNFTASAFSVHSVVECSECRTEYLIGYYKDKKQFYAMELNKV